MTHQTFKNLYKQIKRKNKEKKHIMLLAEKEKKEK